MSNISNTVKFSQDDMNSVEEYVKYRRIVGDDDGGIMFTPKEYEDYKKRVLPTRMKNRLFTSWTNKNGVDCKLIGPETSCFCTHRYKQHKTEFESLPDSDDIIQLPCKVDKCRCSSFNYIPLVAGNPLKCTCKHSSLDHDSQFPHKCLIGGCKQCKGFKSSYTCQCGEKYSDHKMVIETREEREKRGHPVGYDVPYQAMGGLTGFSSLCDGYERMDPSGKVFRDPRSDLDFDRLSISNDVSDIKHLRQPNESELDYYHRRYEEKLKENKKSLTKKTLKK